MNTRPCPGTSRSRWQLSGTALVSLLFALLMSVAARGEPETLVAVDLLYASNRVPLSDSADEEYFSQEAGGLHFGTATVALEQDDDRDSGQWPTVATDSIEPDWVTVEPAVEDALPGLVDAVARDRGSDTALVYVHGFMKSFSNAVRDLGSIVYGSHYDGVPIVFSWPAGTTPLGYEDDTFSLTESIPQLAATLMALSEAREIAKIHLVAHSMGNQALLAVLTQFITSGELEALNLGEVILYAPDIDRETFLAETLPVLSQAGIRPTLYVAEFDVPLMSSRVVNNGPRLGDADAGLAVTAAMDTIDATPVAKWLDRHNHHLTRGSQADVELVLEGIPPVDRPTLRAREGAPGRYWEIIKAE